MQLDAEMPLSSCFSFQLQLFSLVIEQLKTSHSYMRVFVSLL